MTRASRSVRTRSPASAATRYVDTGDARIAYRIAGEGDITVLVLQPFWTAMGDVIDDTRGLASYLTRTCRVIVHDRRGTGDSERHPERLTMEALVEDAEAVLTHAGVARAVVLGMGESGPLAVHLAVRRPDRVERLMLVDATLRPITGPGSTMLLHSLRSRPRAGLRTLARTLVDDDAAAAEMGARMAQSVDGPTAARLYEAFLGAGAAPLLPEVAAPTLLAYGVLDRIISEDEAKGMQGVMPNARIGIVQGPAGSDAAMREGWIQIRDFLAEARRGLPPIVPVPLRPVSGSERTRGPDEEAPRTGRGRSQPRKPIDYVPAGRPAPVRPSAAPSLIPRPVLATQSGGRPVLVAWGPPPNVPAEAVELNRRGVDQLLIGEIESALESFRLAVEIAPHYDDAAINHRELLTRLVQRRVSEWEARQAEDAIAESERRAERWARRARNARRRPRWLLGKTA